MEMVAEVAALVRTGRFKNWEVRAAFHHRVFPLVRFRDPSFRASFLVGRSVLGCTNAEFCEKLSRPKFDSRERKVSRSGAVVSGGSFTMSSVGAVLAVLLSTLRLIDC